MSNRVLNRGTESAYRADDGCNERLWIDVWNEEGSRALCSAEAYEGKCDCKGEHDEDCVL